MADTCARCGLPPREDERLDRSGNHPSVYDCLDRLTAVARAAEAALVGGNHLASLLICRLGDDFAERFSVADDPRDVAERMGYGEDFDIWCGWRGLMRLRAALSGDTDDR